jgi:hypothetical protein
MLVVDAGLGSFATDRYATRCRGMSDLRHLLPN